MFRAFPMILIAVLLYNLVVFGGLAAGQHDMGGLLAQKFSFLLFSGDSWSISIGDLFLTLGLLMLFIETIKATRTSKRELLNHALSMLTFIGALVEFIVLKGFGTSTFFLITAMALFDVVAGYTISIVAARRGVAVEHHDYQD
jgi:hypothetical protein